MPVFGGGSVFTDTSADLDFNVFHHPVMSEVEKVDFNYADADKHEFETAELYSYTEDSEFASNQACFEELAKAHGFEKWTSLSYDDQIRFVVGLQDDLEVTERDKRVKAIQGLLYLVQGVFGECKSQNHMYDVSRRCVLLYLDLGLYTSLVQLLAMEVENSNSALLALRKPAVSITDSRELRFILNILYIMVETARTADIDKDLNDPVSQKLVEAREMFKEELVQPVFGEDPLSVLLFTMVTRFCSGSAPHYPMKKVLLLLWKVVLLTLGGLRELEKKKNEVRIKHNLPPLSEDMYTVCETMRPASPPASAADLIEHQVPRRGIRAGKRSSLDDSFEAGLARDEEDDLMDGLKTNSDDDSPPTPPRPATPTISHRSLPWKPKVRLKDLENFLDHTRQKFVGFEVKNDHSSLAGLPHPIHEGVKVLKQHLYISLSEVQIKREEEIAKNPLSLPETEVENTPAERLYHAMLSNLPQYMIALLKLLLAAAPTSKAKTESINILSDVLPDEMPTTVLQSMKLGIDVNRHKEIIVKAISGLLLLLLKHLKLNHIYQFEFTSQHLVFANCIPLVLKFFNQDIVAYVNAKNSIPALDFPENVLGDQPELTAENIESGDSQPNCWRNIFSCINLLRILNKLTKWKHSRTMMLVVFKSAPILKRALKVRHPMMQLYILKLLKMQTKYLGRQWRKSNMKTMSAIYQKVRHRLGDDWAYGNDMDARPWDFQAEECALRACVDRFNNRRYTSGGCAEPDFRPVDNNILSLLGQNIELSPEFKVHYERWLHMEVYSRQIDWDQVMLS
ncbi:striatin-interacting protein 1-like isoform X2 [Physella acuta]|uniref:striatin-interacting protein 1-like isoform X2 n=1 Tax=Physella acuta TaxID=109671 RepID=UPI0027DDBF30|nr:striatin-interacting protein 1-like isoform X2 [Physella acuta]